MSEQKQPSQKQIALAMLVGALRDETRGADLKYGEWGKMDGAIKILGDLVNPKPAKEEGGKLAKALSKQDQPEPTDKPPDSSDGYTPEPTAQGSEQSSEIDGGDTSDTPESG